MTAKNSNPTGYENDRKPTSQPRYNRIIVIDDSEIDLQVEQVIMKSMNLAKAIDLRLTAEEVIQELQNIKRLDEVPELIFLDLNMPGLSGLGFLNAFNSLPEFVKQKCSIVIVTETNDKNTVDLTYTNPNVIDYVVKPLDAVSARKFLTYEKTAR